MTGGWLLAHAIGTGGVHWPDLVSALLASAVVGGLAVAWTGRRERRLAGPAGAGSTADRVVAGGAGHGGT